MKKRFILLGFIAFMMQCSALKLMGQDPTATWVAADLNYANGTSVTDAFTIGDYAQCHLQKGLGSSAPAFYNNHVRLYVKNTITVRSLNGASISKVEFTFKKNGSKTYLPVASVTPVAPAQSYGTWTDPTPANANDTVVAIWEGALKEDLVITMGNSGQRILIKIVVTYTSPDQTIYYVTYKPNGGLGNDVVFNGVYNTLMTVEDDLFSHDELVFDTWNTEADGSGDDYNPGLTFPLEHDLDLYAQWTTSSDLFVDVFNPTNVNTAIGANLGYSQWTISLPDSEHPRITYQGKSAKNANSIQMTSSISGLSAYSGIATTFTHNLKARKVKVTWDGATSDGGQLDIYGKDTPYAGTSDLYGETQGTLLGSIVKGTSTELDIVSLGDYPYIGLRSNSGAIYLAEVRVIWETYDVTAPVVRIEPTSIELGNVAINNPLSVNFTVSQANLSEAVTLQSSPAIGTFSVNGATVTSISAGAEPTVVTWNYTPTTAGAFTVNVTAASGSVSGHLSISGTVLSAGAQTLHESKAAFVANNSQSSACINLADVEVIAQSANYLYLQDADAGLLVYGSGAPTLQTPCKFTSGYLQGTFVNYHGIIELQNFQFVDAVTTQNMTLTVTTATINEVLASPSTYDSRYVQLNNVNISNWTLTGTSGTLPFHDRFNTGYASKTAPETTDAFTVKGLVNGYYASSATNYQIDPIALADIHTDVKAPQPSISPESLSSSNPSQATTVVLGPQTNTQAHIVYYYKINQGEFIPFTTWTYINLYDAQTTLTAYGTRDFYTDSNPRVSYYVQPQNTHTVRFSINGVVNVSNNALVTGQLSASQTPDVTCFGDFGFAGWSLSESSTQTITLPYTVNDNITLYAVYAKGSNFVYRKVNSVSEFVDGEYIIFAESNDKYTIKNSSSTHSPTAYSMTNLGISINGDNELVVAGNDFSELTWNFTGTASNMQITSTANNTNHLYIIGNSSTGVRVGHTSENTSWSINEDVSVVEQFNMKCNDRYLVLYSNQDWRSYTTLNNQNSYPRLLIFRKQAVVDANAPRFTRVFWNETVTGNITLVGPAIVPSGYYLDMADNIMYNSNASNFIIEDNASFKIAYGNRDIMAKVQKEIAGYVYDTVRTGWHLLSSPIGAFSSHDTHAPSGLLSGDYDLYAFDQSSAMEWQNYEAGAEVVFGQQGGVLYANKNNTTIEFMGELTSTVLDTILTYVPNKRMSGWNIIGNPYTSAGYLNIEYDSEAAPITDYYRLNDVSENGKKFSKLIATSLSTPVDPMEGVFIQAPSTGYRYKFVNSSRSQIVAPSEYVSIKLNDGDGEVVDVARVRFDEGCLMAKFDFGEGGSQLFIPQGGKRYAVVPTQCHGELPLSFQAAQNGTYTLEFDLDNAEIDYLHLIDNKTGADVDLLETPSYTFDATKDDYTARFRLLFEANGALGDSNFAYYDGSVWVVTGSYENATVQVVDMMGRVLNSQTFDGSAELNINQAQGVYVLRLINNNEIKSQKIIVR